MYCPARKWSAYAHHNRWVARQAEKRRRTKKAARLIDTTNKNNIAGQAKRRSEVSERALGPTLVDFIGAYVFQYTVIYISRSALALVVRCTDDGHDDDDEDDNDGDANNDAHLDNKGISRDLQTAVARDSLSYLSTWCPSDIHTRERYLRLEDE